MTADPIGTTTTREISTAEVAVAGIIDRGKDADAIRDRILEARQRLIVLYGKSRSGKSDFVRNWLAPRLRAAGSEVYVGKCEPDLPEEFESHDNGIVPLDVVLTRPAVVFVDSFDRFLALPRDERRSATERAFARFDTEGQGVKVVLVTDSSQLSNAYSLTAYDPDLISAVFEIPPVTVAQGVSSLSRRESMEEITYTKDVLGVLTSESRVLEKQGWEVTFDFIQFLDRGVRSYAAEKGKRSINRDDLKALGGIMGMLRQHYEARLSRSPFETETERETLQVTLESIVNARLEGRTWNADELTARLGVDSDEINRVLHWLTSPNGVLVQEGGKSELECSPPQLAAVIVEDGESRRITIDRVRRIVDEGVRSWEQLGSLLSLARFADVHRSRRFLMLDETSERFLLLCALRYDATDPSGPAVYWLGRINDRVDAMDILLSSVFDDDPRVRARAAALLREFPEPEVYERLMVTALVDADADVRSAAVSSLGDMKGKEQPPQRELLDDVQQRLLGEVQGEGSPYRDHAIEALRVFPSADISNVLQKLVNHPETELAQRERAIGVLAALELPESVDALVSIALKDPDETDRTAAAAALSVTRSESLAARVLKNLGGYRRVSQAWLYVVTFVWLVVAVAAFAALVATEASVPLGILVILAVMAPIPAGWLLRRIRDGRIPRKSGRGIVAGVLYAICAGTVFYLIHGLAHLLIGRWRRALVLFALEMVSLLLFNAGSTFTEVMGGGVSILYFGTGFVLFLFTYIYDVAAVLGQTLMMTAKNQVLQRKALVYEQVMANPAAAKLVFDDLLSSDKRTVVRARRLLRAFGQRTQPEQLVALVSSGDDARSHMAARALKLSKVDDTVRRLEALWKTSDARLRSVINGILCGRPTQASLQALGRLRADMNLWARARVIFAGWNFRMSVWPLWGRLVAAAALPAIIYFAYNGFQASRNPAWSQLVTLRRSLHPDPLQSFLGLGPRLESSDRLARLIGFLAENHPNESGEEFLAHLTGSENRGRLTKQMRAALANGILVIAVTPIYDLDDDLEQRMNGADSAAMAALFLGDSTGMPAAIERLTRAGRSTAFGVPQAAARLLSRVVLARVPEPDSALLREEGLVSFAGPDTIGIRVFKDSLNAHAEEWKEEAVDALVRFDYRIALPVLDTLLRQRSENAALARLLRDNMELVTEYAYGDVRRAAEPLVSARELLGVLDSLTFKPELTVTVREYVGTLETRPAGMHVDIQDPQSEDGYQHAFEEFDTSGRYEDAVALFAQLKVKYDRSIWPRKFLAMVHHENLALKNRSSFAESYREMNELLAMPEFKAMRTQDTITYYRVLADYDEIALSAGDYATVERIAAELGAAGREDLYRYNSVLFAYFARVLSRDAVGAGVALNRLKEVTRSLPVDFYNNWRYPGTLVYLRSTGLPATVIDALVELCKEGYWFTASELQAVLARNESALAQLR